MKLSIYIPTLKCDALFDRCLTSIRKSIPCSRVEGVDYEIVVVEGVSPVGEARNVGLRKSSGEWIATVDADDVVAENWFPEIWNAIETAERMGNVDDVVFDMVVKKPNREYVDTYGRNQIVDSKVLIDDVLRDIRIGSHLFRHVMNRRILEGITFERGQILEDYLAMPKILARARKVLYIPKPLYHYILRRESLCYTASIMEFFNVALRRANEYGGPAIIGASKVAYYILHDRVDENGIAQRWIRRHIWRELTDPEFDWKWRFKFLTAFFGFIIRRPR